MNKDIEGNREAEMTDRGRLNSRIKQELLRMTLYIAAVIVVIILVIKLIR